METPMAAAWAALDDHFQHHVRLVERFREAGRDAVSHMWSSQTNEAGKRLSQFEREALMERHCELFGTWPARRPYRADDAELKRADTRIAEGKRRVADLRRKIAKQECLGRDTQLSNSVLVTLETSLQLMTECRHALGNSFERRSCAPRRTPAGRVREPAGSGLNVNSSPTEA
jgi:hypothetical protein